MEEQFEHDDRSLLLKTANVVASFVSYNSLNAGALAELVSTVHSTFQALNSQSEAGLSAPTPAPAVPINRSITPDLIYCLENGKGYRMLKRHLWTAYGMTPDQYRQKWGLPADYPMVAPGYSVVRSALAISAGLGASGRATRSNATRNTAPSKAGPK
jgi:predicted transcriptional regulator